MAKEPKNVELPIIGKESRMMDETECDIMNLEHSTTESNGLDPQIQQTVVVVNVQDGSIELNNVELIIDDEDGKSTDEPKLDVINMDNTIRE